MWTLKHKRSDSTFVIELNGYPYHVINDDPLYEQVAAAALAQELDPEPVPQPEPISTWEQVRQERNLRLTLSDWTQLPDVNLSESQTAAWRSYRQQLRDITDQFDDPSKVVWPSEPLSES